MSRGQAVNREPRRRAAAACRARPRLADGHAGRRESSRGHLRACIRTPRSSACSCPRTGVAGDRAAPRPDVLRAAAARGRRGATASSCRFFPPRSSFSTSTASTSSSARATARSSRSSGPAGRSTSATVTPRCGTPGISSGPISAQLRSGTRRSRLLRPVMAALARWDRATAGRVDSFVANSRYVAERIRRYYNRESTVVYPPVDTAFYRPDDDRRPTRSGFLVVSALVPYKRLDVAIDACRQLGAPLTIVGTGPELARLQAMAGPDVTFLGWRSNEDIRELYRRSDGHAPARRRRLRDGPGRSAGLRLSGRGARERRRRRDGRRRRDRRARLRPLGRSVRRRAEPRARLAFEEPALRDHALQFSRDRFLTVFRARLTPPSLPAETRIPPPDGPRSTAARPSDDAALQPPARGVLRRHGRAARDGGVRHRLPAALRDVVRRLRPGHERPAAVWPVPQHTAAARRPRAARVPRPGTLPAASRPHPRGRLLRGFRGQHPRGGARPHRDAVPTRSTTPPIFRSKLRRRGSTRSHGRSGCSSSPSTSSSPTPRASSCARRSSAAGARVSASSAC